jgi:hypothetical protein
MSMKREQVHAAALDCRHCGRCGRPLEALQPVWRSRLMINRGPFKVSYIMAPECECCGRRDWRTFQRQKPCEHCERPVHELELLTGRSHRRTFCCQTCEMAARAASAKRHRSDARGTRQCATCGEMFEPSRIDARFCCGGCKQVAYRRRKAVTVTDVNCLADATIISRNANP